MTAYPIKEFAGRHVSLAASSHRCAQVRHHFEAAFRVSSNALPDLIPRNVSYVFGKSGDTIEMEMTESRVVDV